jgi:hypothetical protein
MREVVFIFIFILGNLPERFDNLPAGRRSTVSHLWNVGQKSVSDVRLRRQSELNNNMRPNTLRTIAEEE